MSGLDDLSTEPKQGKANKTVGTAAKSASHSANILSIRSSYIWALVFTVVIAVWMFSGQIVVGGKSDIQASSDTTVKNSTDKQKKPPVENTPFKVRARTFVAQPRDAVLTIRGRTEADAKVDIKAETQGIVELVPVDKGTTVKKGDNLCQLETGARKANLLEAKAQVARAHADYKANSKLAQRGHTAKLRLVEFKAKLDAANAALKRVELDLERTKIDAPFDGIVEEQPAKVGDFLSVGGHCATLVTLDPLIVVGTVSERVIGNVKPGMAAEATLVTGETVKGHIRFVSASADRNTRTFRVELEVANKNNVLRDGVTAEISVPLNSAPAHRFSPAILVLNDKGQVGVRIVEKENTVRFVPVTILSQEQDGIWVAGLPKQVSVITVGQDYVTNGQKITVIDETVVN